MSHLLPLFWKWTVFQSLYPCGQWLSTGDSLYVAAGAEGLHVVDLSVPWNPGLLATHPAQSESLFLAGRLVYLATGSDGLHLLKAGPIGAAFLALL